MNEDRGGRQPSNWQTQMSQATAYLDLDVTHDGHVATAEIRLGFHPGFGLTVTLPRLIGQQRAALLFYTGRRISGAEAVAMGLADLLVADTGVRGRAQALAQEIAQSASLAVLSPRATLRRGLVDKIEQHPSVNSSSGNGGARPLISTKVSRQQQSDASRIFKGASAARHRASLKFPWGLGPLRGLREAAARLPDGERSDRCPCASALGPRSALMVTPIRSTASVIEPDGAHGHVPRAGERDVRPTLARMPMTASPSAAVALEPRWCKAAHLRSRVGCHAWIRELHAPRKGDCLLKGRVTALRREVNEAWCR